MTCLLLFLIILSTGLIQKFEAKPPVKAGLQIYGIVNACPGQYYPIKIANVSVKLENGLFFLRFDVMVEESTNEDFNFEMAVTRCLDKSAPDTCEEFHKYTFRRFCKMMKIPGPWLTYLESMKPPYECPTKKGLYTMTKSITCSVKDIERMNFGDGYFFKVEMKSFGVNTNKMYTCIRVDGQK